jgi:hypothetical protein
MEINNWKLKEILESIKIINKDSMEFIDETLFNLNLPVKHNEHMNTGETFINWNLMNKHHSFFFDYIGNEDEVKERIANSLLKEYNSIIVTYGHSEPTVEIDMRAFLNEWEEIFSSTLYNSLMFSPDYKLIMEITRDYHLHSNFLI